MWSGVTSELRALGGNSEFLFVGSGVRADSATRSFTSAGDAQELYCHMDAGYEPREFVFGNIAYSVGAVGGIAGTLKTLVRGEIKEFSDVFNETRHHALDRVLAHAKAVHANAVVGIRTIGHAFCGLPRNVHGGHRRISSGAARAMRQRAGEQRSYRRGAVGLDASWDTAPVKLLISTSVYSLGALGGLKAAFKGFVKGEISRSHHIGIRRARACVRPPEA